MACDDPADWPLLQFGGAPPQLLSIALVGGGLAALLVMLVVDGEKPPPPPPSPPGVRADTEDHCPSFGLLSKLLLGWPEDGSVGGKVVAPW